LQTETYITEFLVHLEDLVGDLCARDHWPFTDFLEDGAGQKDQLLVLFLVVVTVVVIDHGQGLHDLALQFFDAPIDTAEVSKCLGGRSVISEWYKVRIVGY